MTIFTKNEILSRIRANFPDMLPERVSEAFLNLEELGVVRSYEKKYFHIYLLDDSSPIWRDLMYNTTKRRQ